MSYRLECVIHDGSWDQMQIHVLTTTVELCEEAERGCVVVFKSPNDDGFSCSFTRIKRDWYKVGENDVPEDCSFSWETTTQPDKARGLIVTLRQGEKVLFCVISDRSDPRGRPDFLEAIQGLI